MIFYENKWNFQIVIFMTLEHFSRIQRICGFFVLPVFFIFYFVLIHIILYYLKFGLYKK